MLHKFTNIQNEGYSYYFSAVCRKENDNFSEFKYVMLKLFSDIFSAYF